MNKKKFTQVARNVIDLEIKGLQKLKRNIGSSFDKAVIEIAKCQSKVIVCGVGKSGLIASKIAATLSSVGTPSFNLSASDSSHGDLGSIQKKDVLILISYSGQTNELKNIIQYANRNKILLIGIMSKKESILYKASDIKLLIPQVSESGGIVPTSSTTVQLALGDALAIAAMQYKKFDKFDFKKIHPAGSLGAQLKTVEDLMVTGNKIPFVNENELIKNALKILNLKKLGITLVEDKSKIIGIFTDGDLRRCLNQKLDNGHTHHHTLDMTKKPYIINPGAAATEILSQMNKRKITNVCVYNKGNKRKTIGVLHIHNLINNLR